MELEAYDSSKLRFPFVVSAFFIWEGMMIKLDIVNQVADKTGVPKQKAEQVLDGILERVRRFRFPPEKPLDSSPGRTFPQKQ